VLFQKQGNDKLDIAQRATLPRRILF